MASDDTALAVVPQFQPTVPRKKNDDPLRDVIPPGKAPVMPQQRAQLEQLVRDCVEHPLSRKELENLCYIFRRAHGQGVAAGMRAIKKG